MNIWRVCALMWCIGSVLQLIAGNADVAAMYIGVSIMFMVIGSRTKT